MSQDPPADTTGLQRPGDADFSQLDDSTLLSRRAEMRAEMERLPQASPGRVALAARYDISTQEVNDRARRAWALTGRTGR
jgi:hypothetical protein